jgi:RNA polymerase sigma-70 factor, ECF subfamily
VIDPDAFAKALAARELTTESAHAADVALVLALAANDAAALARFEREVLAEIRGPLARVAGGSADLVDEGLQRAREKLLVGTPPRILEYRGRGSLAAWVQILAIREVLMLNRRDRRNMPPLEDTMLAAVETDPVLAITKSAYRDAFATIFRASFAELEPRQRALLRLTFAEGAGTEKLAAMYGVHRVTMFRWLADARAALLDRVRKGVQTRIGINPAEIDSLIRAVASSLDIDWH